MTSPRAPRPVVCVVGDALLDIDWIGEVSRVCRDAPAPVRDSPIEHARPGGAALAACLAARAGADVTLVTGIGTDEAGRRLSRLLADAGVRVVDLGLAGPMPVKLRLRADGHSIARIDRACTPVLAPGRWTAAAEAAMAGADVIHVADYGRGLAARPEVAAAAAALPTVWDPYPPGPRPPLSVALVTPNIAEAQDLAGDRGPAPTRLPEVVDLATAAARVVGAPTVVTAGALGAVLADGAGPPAVVPAIPAQGDVCGAGDQFAANAAVGLGRGPPVLEAIEAAVAAAATFVAEGGAGPALEGAGAVVPLPSHPGTNAAAGDAVATAQAVRRAGGVVVAAGGCFDVLHAGHVQLLEGARRLGDHLVVCLNSDASVQRLKGRAVRSTRPRTGWRCCPASPASTAWWCSTTTPRPVPSPPSGPTSSSRAPTTRVPIWTRRRCWRGGGPRGPAAARGRPLHDAHHPGRPGCRLTENHASRHSITGSG